MGDLLNRMRKFQYAEPGYWRLVFAFIIVAGVCFLYTVLPLESKNTPNAFETEMTKLLEFRKLRPETPAPVSAEKIFKCLIESFKDGDSFASAITWLQLDNAVRKCRKPAENSVIADVFVGAEAKYFVPGPTPDFDYTMMTIGVGHNIDAEKKILEKYTKCSKYVGADPTSEFNEKLVTDAGGQFLELTVGAKDDVYAARILEKQGDHLQYRTQNATHTSLQSAFKKAGIENAVDLLLMDVEGAEFEILESFIDKPENHTTICQFNVEVHSPWTNGINKSNIIHTLYRLSKKREFMLFHVQPALIVSQHEVFNRCFFINVKDPYCVKKYYPAFLE